MKRQAWTPRIVEPESDEIALLRKELEDLKAKVPAPKESRDEIIARIRSGMGPTRPIVVRALERTFDPETERFL